MMGDLGVEFVGCSLNQFDLAEAPGFHEAYGLLFPCAVAERCLGQDLECEVVMFHFGFLSCVVNLGNTNFIWIATNLVTCSIYLKSNHPNSFSFSIMYIQYSFPSYRTFCSVRHLLLLGFLRALAFSMPEPNRGLNLYRCIIEVSELYISCVWIFSMSDNHLASRHDIGDAFRVSSAAGRSKHVVAVPLPALHFPAEYPSLSPRLVYVY